MRENVSDGTEWEKRVGYSRAVRVGDRISVSGTTATDEANEVVGVGEPYRQTERALENVVRAIEEAGGTVEDIVRTRMFVTDIEHWEEIGDAHEAFFGETRPATSMVQVDRLIDPAMLVEIEAEAIVQQG